ncbi:MAG: hypothetical protein PHI19_01985 [Clostridia bacterium]|nr:hypothetical protein [Clostridia bacterium]
MKYDTNTNTLINEIMANNTSAVMLFAPSGTGKTDFLTELSNRYHTVFWFNAVVDDFDLFCHTMLDKVVKNEEPFKLKMYQLLYCNSTFNDHNVVAMSILDYISKIKGNCLMVFERMERLSKDFDLSLLERMIKHCPSNLKIVISSDCFINFNYTRFEPIYPKLIDENILTLHTPLPDCKTYLEGLDQEQIAFLTYISELIVFDSMFVREIYPQGEELLRMLSRKEYYVATRDVRYFRINTLLRNYLAENKEKCESVLKEKFYTPLIPLYADYLYGVGEYYQAFLFNCKQNRLGEADKCIKAILDDCILMLRLPDFAASRNQLVYPEVQEGYPYYKLYLALVSKTKGDYETSNHYLKELVTEFGALDDNLAEAVAAFNLTKNYAAEGRESQIPEVLNPVMAKLSRINHKVLNMLYCVTVPYRKELNVPITEYENKILRQECEKSFLYIKAMEDLSIAYFNIGNYRRAITISNKLKDYLPTYVVPHSQIAFRYYEGEVELAEIIAKDALAFAETNEIETDIGLIYSTLGMIDLYYGKVQEALAKYDIAVKLSKENNATRYYVIGQRCIAYARFGDPNYAKEVAHIYLKQCETYYPKYSSMLQLALSYSYLKLGDSDKAYKYATQCVQSSLARSTNWLIGVAIATTHMLVKGDLKDAPTLVKNILKSSFSYGMKMIVVDNYYDIFSKIIAYAKQNKIEADYVQEVEDDLKKKEKQKHSVGSINIDLFGDIRIAVGNEIIQWKTRKSKDLFLHYILAGEQGIDRSVIIDYLWKDYLYESAINNLKTTNNIIRKTLTNYNIEYKLDYVNSRYILHIENLESDYAHYKSLMQRYKVETSLPKMMDNMNHIIELYKGDFATDVFYTDFADERKSIKQEMVFGLLRLVRSLAMQGEYMEAKRYLSSLIVIDKQTDYSHMVAELDSRINLTE